MQKSDHYDEIKNRAIEMLMSPEGFNGLTTACVRSRRRPTFALRNGVGVALCMARDEVQVREGGRKVFNTGNFRKAEAEILRALRGAPAPAALSGFAEALPNG
jgi:hypothetical protein